MLQIHRVYGYFSIESSIETSQPLDIIFKRNLQSDFPDDFQVRHRDIKGIASFKKVKTDEFLSVEDPKAFSYDTNGNQIKFHEFKDKSQVLVAFNPLSTMVLKKLRKAYIFIF